MSWFSGYEGEVLLLITHETIFHVLDLRLVLEMLLRRREVVQGGSWGCGLD